MSQKQNIFTLKVLKAFVISPKKSQTFTRKKKQDKNFLSNWSETSFKFFRCLRHDHSRSTEWTFFRLVKISSGYRCDTRSSRPWGSWLLWIDREISLVCWYQNNLFSPFHFSPTRIGRFLEDFFLHHAELSLQLARDFFLRAVFFQL